MFSIDFVSTSTFHPFIAADGTNVATITTTAPSLTDVNTYATRVKENDYWFTMPMINWIGIENINAIANGFLAHHSHLNCPFV